jgi:acetyl-CoA C-acetyltransferase
MPTDSIVILSAKRTPIGGFQGDFASLSASDLGAVAIRAAVADAGIAPEQIEGGIMGNVLMAGQGQAPARQAILKAGLSEATAATTLNKMCGSGMQAVMDAHDRLIAHSADILLAGGMESMTNAPYLLLKARAGLRMGHGEVKDSMFLDGLEDAYETGRLMGSFADETARDCQFTRAAQDEYALRSLARAKIAIEGGGFAHEIAPVTIPGKAGDVTVAIDEQPGKARPEKIPTLKPAFAKDGTVTAANASSISDGAAALILTRASHAQAHGLTPLARIVAHTTHAAAPAKFSTAPIGAIEKLFAKTGWTAADVDLFEINEAFAIVAMAAIRDLGLDPAKVNIHGGATALGHPIGASGARILVTLLAALKDTGGKRGVASLCIGGGEATAMAVELMH